MRTSGPTGRDGFMTAVPLAMLVVFVVWLGGGPRGGAAWIEGGLQTIITWIGEWTR